MSITKGRSTTMKHSRTLRLPALAATIVLAGLLVAACGSSSNTGSATASSSTSAAAAAGGAASSARSKLAACLKAHGVTLPARPAGARRRPPGGYGGYGGYGGGAPGFFFGGGGGASGSGGPGAGRFDNPKFRAALKACGGGSLPQRRATPNKAAVTKFAACVTQHGYTLPAPNFSGKGPIFPAAISRNKKFQAAAKACASDLRPQTAAGAGGAGSSAPPGSGSSSD
jgi:hypothetical protein